MNTKQLVDNNFRKRSFLCVGQDSDPKKLPSSLLERCETPAQAMLEFNKAIIAAVAPYCVAFKPNTAF